MFTTQYMQMEDRLRNVQLLQWIELFCSRIHRVPTCIHYEHEQIECHQ